MCAAIRLHLIAFASLLLSFSCLAGGYEELSTINIIEDFITHIKPMIGEAESLIPLITRQHISEHTLAAFETALHHIARSLAQPDINKKITRYMLQTENTNSSGDTVSGDLNMLFNRIDALDNVVKNMNATRDTHTQKIKPIAKRIFRMQSHYVPSHTITLPMAPQQPAAKTIHITHDGARIIHHTKEAARTWNINLNTRRINQELESIVASPRTLELCTLAPDMPRLGLVIYDNRATTDQFNLCVYDTCENRWELKKTFVHQYAIEQVQFVPHQDSVITCSNSNTICFWPLSDDDLCIPSLQFSLLIGRPDTSLCVAQNATLFFGDHARVLCLPYPCDENPEVDTVNIFTSRTKDYRVSGCDYVGKTVVYHNDKREHIISTTMPHDTIAHYNGFTIRNSITTSSDTDTTMAIATSLQATGTSPKTVLSIAQKHIDPLVNDQYVVTQRRLQKECTPSDVRIISDKNIVLIATTDGRLIFFDDLIGQSNNIRKALRNVYRILLDMKQHRREKNGATSLYSDE